MNWLVFLGGMATGAIIICVGIILYIHKILGTIEDDYGDYWYYNT